MRRSLAFLLAVAATVTIAPSASADVRYEPAGGCWAVRDVASGTFLARDGDGWRASAATPAEAAPLRWQATALGSYLLFGTDAEHVEADGDAARAADAPSGDADWTVEPAGGDTFTLVLEESGQRLAVAADGRLVVRDTGTPMTLAPATGCADFPESEVNVAGAPYRGPTTFGETKGLTETHLHTMAFEFLGGSVHCGRPWHPYGIAFAMVDCPDHGPNGQGALAENFLAYGDPTKGHDTDGWPTFEGWPHHRTYTHEQTYYKNLERAWRGGLRVLTTLLVENAVLCELYPIKRNTCDEMEVVRLQARQLFAMRDYIDAQSGGPGKGWFQIVTDPFQARRVINEGKLAAIVGIENSRLFNCREYNHQPLCDRESIDRQFDEMYDLGVRQMELVNKFDNALVGVAGDGGTFGVLTNSGNKYETNHFLAMDTCDHPTAAHDHDNEQNVNSSAFERDELAGGILALFGPQEQAPVYPPGPHCNQQGLTELGAYVLRRMMEKGMIFDPDHMSVLGRDQALSIVEAEQYGGVMSSHSWSTPDAYRRILALGGLVTPASKTSERFLRAHKELQEWRNPRYFFGTGFSTDMNGFASQGGPREDAAENPLPYPFESLDGATSLDRQKVGTRVYDLNEDGTAHFGLFPDRVADIAHVGGPEVKRDLVRGAEAYLQMWERAEGIAPPTCRAAQRRFKARGLGEARVGWSHRKVLRRAGQPQRRPNRRWTYCVDGTRGGKVRVLFTKQGKVALLGSTAPQHTARGIGRGFRADRLLDRTKRIAPGVIARPVKRGARMIHGVRKGRVTFTGVIPKALANKPKRLVKRLKAAKLR